MFFKVLSDSQVAAEGPDLDKTSMDRYQIQNYCGALIFVAPSTT